MYLADRLEHINFEMRSPQADRVIDIFLEIGLTFPQIFDVYTALDVRGAFCVIFVNILKPVSFQQEASWAKPDERLHLGFVIYALISKWWQHLKSGVATPYERKQFESKPIKELINEWIGKAQTNKHGSELTQYLTALKNQIMG